MGASYTRLLFHVIFSTKNRLPLIADDLQPRLFAYAGGILANERGELLCAGGTADHVHLLMSLHAQSAVADILRLVKTNSSKWVHESFSELRDFGWQSGYAAFSVSASNVARVRAYIQRQPDHHRRRSFQEEFIEFLKRHDVAYDERYIWE